MGDAHCSSLTSQPYVKTMAPVGCRIVDSMLHLCGHCLITPWQKLKPLFTLPEQKAPCVHMPESMVTRKLLTRLVQQICKWRSLWVPCKPVNQISTPQHTIVPVSCHVDCWFSNEMKYNSLLEWQITRLCLLCSSHVMQTSSLHDSVPDSCNCKCCCCAWLLKLGIHEAYARFLVGHYWAY